MRGYVLAVAAGFCTEHYTCCCQYDFFIPVMCQCVEDEPGFLGKNNCARDDRSKPGPLAPVVSGDKRAWLHGICNENTTVVTRAELEQREAKEAAWQAHFHADCLDNGAHCAPAEQCWYDGRRDTYDAQGHSTGSVWQAGIEAGAACVCPFPKGRSSAGACVDCPGGKYVQKTDPKDPGAATFKNGEFHCAEEQTLV